MPSSFKHGAQVGTALSHLCENVRGKSVDQIKETDPFLLTTKNDVFKFHFAKELRLAGETMLTGSGHNS